MLENLLLGALFFVLVPGILVSLPRGGSKVTVALVHAVVFVLAYTVLQSLAGYGGYGYAVYNEEGFKRGFSGSYNVKDMGGRMCPYPYDCVRGKGWFNGLSICKCKEGGDIPSDKTAIFRDSDVDVRKLEYR